MRVWRRDVDVAMSGSLDAAYFDGLYAANPDPWDFASSAYEDAKYTATLAALPAARFAAGLEIGCSIGVLTRRLAERCDRLLAVDLAAAALQQARARCADLAHVTFAQLVTPQEWPAGRFDLIMLSEVLYYLVPEAQDAMAARVCDALLPGGAAMLVHWLGPTNYPTTGDAAATRFIAASTPTLSLCHQARTAEYRLDLLTRP